MEPLFVNYHHPRFTRMAERGVDSSYQTYIEIITPFIINLT